MSLLLTGKSLSQVAGLQGLESVSATQKKRLTEAYFATYQVIHIRNILRRFGTSNTTLNTHLTTIL
jgi:hypothetical protein